MGNTNNIVFVEELVSEAPQINGWKFTALKPAMNIDNMNIRMHDVLFDKDNMYFYANDHVDYPDEIDITVTHNALTEENKAALTNGVYIYLDNYLGELDFLNNIDELSIISTKEAQKELIAISKLKDYLIWRQKEFIEKYEGTGYNTENDTYSILEAELDNGNMLIAVINTQLLQWNRKASHPWIGILTVKYDGSNTNGLPTNNDYEIMNQIEDELLMHLIDKEGYLNIGRETANSEKEIFFACKDFRKPSKIFYEIQKKYADTFEIEYNIYKDKYWRSFEKYNQH
jgi:hypothetical protein